VAVTVLGPDRHIILALEFRERRLQQPTFDTIRQFVATSFDRQRVAIVSAQNRTDRACRLALGCKRQRNENAAIRPRDALGAATRIDSRSAWVVPVELGGLGELSVRRAHHIDRIALQLRPRQAAAFVVVNIVADRQNRIGRRVVFRHDITDALGQVVPSRMAPQGGDSLGLRPGAAQVRGRRPMHVAKHVGPGNGL